MNKHFSISLLELFDLKIISERRLKKSEKIVPVWNNNNYGLELFF